MQLKPKKIVGLLSLATASLISNSVHAEETEWNVDTALLIYSETDRVSAVEPVVSLSRDLGDGEILSMKFVLDSLTGASATGAVPSQNIQTFTRPSGNGSYTVPANETPLDDTFKDTRAAFALSIETPIDRNNRRTIGFNISKEFDFFSLGGHFLWQHDMYQKNTTLSAGINLEIDQISPVGGAPTPLSDVSLLQKDAADKDKNIIDLVFGVTQVINKKSLFQVNLSLSQADGYLTDPYKVVSIVDATGEPTSHIFEHRKNKRSRQSLFGKYKLTLDNKDVFTTSYRYMTDNWGVISHTVDTTFKYKLSNGYYVQPHIRLYQQSAANFYRYFLQNNEAIPEYISADYRLGKMTTSTIGLKFGQDINAQHSWSARLEFYQQSGDSSPDEAIGQLQQQDLFPGVEAVIIQTSYSFKW